MSIFSLEEARKNTECSEMRIMCRSPELFLVRVTAPYMSKISNIVAGKYKLACMVLRMYERG